MSKRDLFQRYKKNPILTPDDFPEDWSVNSVLNPGVGDLNGLTHLLVRLEDRRGFSKLVSLYSKNGITNWKVEEDSIFTGNPNLKNQGVEDPRLVWMKNFKMWAIVYTVLNPDRKPLVSIALTKNFKKFHYLDYVIPPPNKDASLFPEPINGYWWLIHRPMVGADKQMYVARSRCTNENSYEDLACWGNHQILLPRKSASPWDANHNGLSAQPLKTEEGWLLLYHGVRKTGGGILYRLGLAMLALDDPTRVTHRTKEFVMSPYKKDYIGDVGGAIFPCGWRLHEDGNIRLYYGAADSEIHYATAHFDEVLERVLKDPV